ncbi:hydrolase, NUDIX family protein [Pseudooceanicola batsensis HTCC2597]|uniref:Hydrolase, NUDIX family protein n=1 Tax=Pseudooceanicola batsensis (strain ATCC BAA-863 / DSM 15984 / KCTC 12145 / HTCC2597) TaxID=252305 RepID=A3TWN6_PSEBH|nr:CoA pyrophosphatase [Pseudooceanicola batsensis]EAQ04032.1 hydrolase, NUDIX family protein [Pseudooceanicola batsensis HTCC2597]
MKAEPASFDRIREALARPGDGSSDFDLNGGAFDTPTKTLRPAGVLVPLIARDGMLNVILTKRTSHLKHHPGQIAFPGGKVEPTDADVTAAALRESQEEIGLPPELVEVVGYLPPHETVSVFSMTPVVARVTRDFDKVPEPGEVEDVFEVPLAHLLDPENYRVQGRRWMGSTRYYFVVPYGPYYIWGATARICRVLADRLA